MARQTFGKDTEYRAFCKANGFVTQNGAVKLTAEVLYRFITNDLSFTEAHTGLEYVMIEKVIFLECFKRGAVDGRLWVE
jgi:hypothetical protein